MYSTLEIFVQNLNTITACASVSFLVGGLICEIISQHLKALPPPAVDNSANATREANILLFSNVAKVLFMIASIVYLAFYKSQ